MHEIMVHPRMMANSVFLALCERLGFKPVALIEPPFASKVEETPKEVVGTGRAGRTNTDQLLKRTLEQAAKQKAEREKQVREQQAARDAERQREELERLLEMARIQQRWNEATGNQQRQWETGFLKGQFDPQTENMKFNIKRGRR